MLSSDSMKFTPLKYAPQWFCDFTVMWLPPCLTEDVYMKGASSGMPSAAMSACPSRKTWLLICFPFCQFTCFRPHCISEISKMWSVVAGFFFFSCLWLCFLSCLLLTEYLCVYIVCMFVSPLNFCSSWQETCMFQQRFLLNQQIETFLLFTVF